MPLDLKQKFEEGVRRLWVSDVFTLLMQRYPGRSQASVAIELDIRGCMLSQGINRGETSFETLVRILNQINMPVGELPSLRTKEIQCMAGWCRVYFELKKGQCTPQERLGVLNTCQIDSPEWLSNHTYRLKHFFWNLHLNKFAIEWTDAKLGDEQALCACSKEIWKSGMSDFSAESIVMPHDFPATLQKLANASGDFRLFVATPLMEGFQSL